jgi:hypothetical protein
MKPGEIYEWLDQGPAVLLEECEIPDVFAEEEFEELMMEGSFDLDRWPTDNGWRVKLLMTDEIIDVHADTLCLDPS